MNGKLKNLASLSLVDQAALQLSDAVMDGVTSSRKRSFGEIGTERHAVKGCILQRMFPTVTTLEVYISSVSNHRISLATATDAPDYLSYIGSIYIVPECSPVEINVSVQKQRLSLQCLAYLKRTRSFRMIRRPLKKSYTS